MSENFTRPNSPALTKIVDDAAKGATIGQNYQDMKDGLRAALGLPPSAESSSFGFGLPDPPPSAACMPEQSAGPQNCVRVVYPHLNDRFEIYAASEEELDRKEAALRAMYGNQ
jgi:hypothetical protein